MSHSSPSRPAIRVHSPSGNHRCKPRDARICRASPPPAPAGPGGPPPHAFAPTSCPLSATCRSSPGVLDASPSSTLHTDAGKLFAQQESTVAPERAPSQAAQPLSHSCPSVLIWFLLHPGPLPAFLLPL